MIRKLAERVVGGHHARTNGGCTVVSAILFCFICIMYKVLPEYVTITLQPVSYIISGFLITHYAPVEDANKPLAEKEVIRYRKISQPVNPQAFFLFKNSAIQEKSSAGFKTIVRQIGKFELLTKADSSAL